MAEPPLQQSHSHPRQLTVAEPSSRGTRPLLPFQKRSVTLPPNVDPRSMPAEVPNPSHRHGTPSGPWPFLDLHVLIEEDIIKPKIPPQRCLHRQQEDQEHCWCKYPQSLYPNWTPAQQKASRISDALLNKNGWKIYPLVVSEKGIFKSLEHKSGQCAEVDDFWDGFKRPEEDCHIHAIFVENMGGPIMQMLGTKYNIEPFFFSSSFGWIPSRYQESPNTKHSDHITITLTFIRCTSDPQDRPKFGEDWDDSSTDLNDSEDDRVQRNIAIKTNEFLWLDSSKKILFSDILSLHMIRHPVDGHTIISYHAPQKFQATPAKKLRDRLRLTGAAVYWSKIFQRSKDPTFVFLSLLWYALYAWDESLEALYNHICFMESHVMGNTELDFTHELHRIRANLLHYGDLLADLSKTVEFVRDTRYPALDNEGHFTIQEKEDSVKLMNKECETLLSEIVRLEIARKMQDKRLTNVMHLGFSTVNIEDSRRMRKLTEAAVRDSAAMKQIAYLTMFFLPASFVATAFGMNVKEINGSSPSLAHYFAAAFPLTAVTIWIMVALQIEIKNLSSPRRRPRPSKAKLKASSFKSPLPDVITPPGHELRTAYTISEGEIIVGSPEDLHEMYNARDRIHKKDNDGYDRYNNSNRDSMVNILKRLLWPISLPYAAFVKWKENKANTAPERGDHGQGSDRHGHWLPFFAKDRTPAARLATDVRSQHSASSRSAEQVGLSTLSHHPLPQLPPSILKRDGNDNAIEQHLGSQAPSSLPHVEPSA